MPIAGDDVSPSGGAIVEYPHAEEKGQQENEQVDKDSIFVGAIDRFKIFDLRFTILSLV
jgi:hypothetical protein